MALEESDNLKKNTFFFNSLNISLNQFNRGEIINDLQNSLNKISLDFMNML
tara:strand:+ start:384 stop:536 length:153 start_codon:yes stop_codon:yes gene_type:complete